MSTGTYAVPTSEQIAAVQGYPSRNTDSVGWFAVYTAPRHEKRVYTAFEQRRIEAFLPLYRSIHRWKNRCRVPVELPLFPSYVFVHIVRNDRRHVVQVPGVVAMVGRSGEPTPLPDSDIECLRTGLQQRPFYPHPYLVAGQKVYVKSGPLAGTRGVVVRKKNDYHVVLTIEMISQSVAAEVDVCDLEFLR